MIGGKERERIRKLRKEGSTYEEIASEVGCAISTAYIYSKEENIKERREKENTKEREGYKEKRVVKIVYGILMRKYTPPQISTEKIVGKLAGVSLRCDLFIEPKELAIECKANQYGITRGIGQVLSYSFSGFKSILAIPFRTSTSTVKGVKTSTLKAVFEEISPRLFYVNMKEGKWKEI